MSLGRYVFAVAAVVAIVMAAAALFFTAERAERDAVFLAAILAGTNTLVAHGLSVWGARRSNKAFFTAVLVGTFVRMALALGAVYVALAVFGVPPLPFVGTLLLLFAVFLAFELRVQAQAPRRVAA